MRYLLDTHTLIWWWTEPNCLSQKAFDVIGNFDNQIFVSPINLWEMSIKYHKGKWDEAKLAICDFEKLMVRDGFDLLPITLQQARIAGQFQETHADPFDRMLVAQAMSENLILISKDSKLSEFNVNLLW